MEVKKLSQNANGFPAVLARIPSPPRELYILANSPLEKLLQRPRIAIVGSRKVSTYGKEITSRFAGELARQGVVIISGLALGVDALAHRAALEAGGLTIAVLPCSLERIYPASHYKLAETIIAQGGALVSEYPPGSDTYKLNFIARNRLVSGLSDAILITEAAERSGTLHTANFALQQGIEVLALPGNITSPTSHGTNNLIKNGATPVTDVADVFHALGIQPAAASVVVKGATPEEQLLLDLIATGITDGAQLLAGSQLGISIFNQTLTMLEITSKVRPLGNNHWSLR